jgi:uncharacterized protein (TIGR02117 family)
MRQIILISVILAISGCANAPWTSARRASHGTSDIQLASYTTRNPRRTIFVMSNGLHTGIVMRRADLSTEVWPEVDEISNRAWVEVGWGSEIFYRAKKITASVVLGAIVPNQSVLHVVGWDTDPEETFAGLDLIKIEVDEMQLDYLCRYIHDTYELDDQGAVQNLGPGIYADGFFFRAKGNYYFPKTCNVWTARCLKAADVPIVPELCGAADAVLIAARQAGTTIHRRGKSAKLNSGGRDRAD